MQSTRRPKHLQLNSNNEGDSDDNDDDRESGARVSERVPTRRSNPPSAIITQIVPHRPTKEYSRKYGEYSVTMLVASSREMISSYGAG